MAVSARWISLAILFWASVSAAEPRRVAVETPVEAFTPQAAGELASTLYVNRCTGGCSITSAGINDATTQNTTIPPAGTYTVREYSNVAQMTGAAADAEWNAVMKCLREVYSPYAITVTDQLPDTNAYNEAIVAGYPGDVGLGSDILGIAPLASNCSAQVRVISFSFANYHGAAARVQNICWTAAQESAHAFGLDHEYEFTDGDSACNDPMTYRVDCGGEKFFRNRRAKCGEMAARGCRCGASQNSHAKLVETFGPGTPITPPPTVAISVPVPNTTVSGNWFITTSAGSTRGVHKIELYFNDSRWLLIDGAVFGKNGQLNPTEYTVYAPAALPDGIIDIRAVAYDDLGIATSSSTITVTKGAPCQSDSNCLADQTCDAGHCRWAAPVGELGEACTYGQYCKSWSCLGDEGGRRCTQDCYTDEPTTCPSELTCLPIDKGPQGLCWPSDNGGCCSVGGDSNGIWIHVGLSALVLGWLRRRRTR